MEMNVEVGDMTLKVEYNNQRGWTANGHNQSDWYSLNRVVYDTVQAKVEAAIEEQRQKQQHEQDMAIAAFGLEVRSLFTADDGYDVTCSKTQRQANISFGDGSDIIVMHEPTVWSGWGYKTTSMPYTWRDAKYYKHRCKTLAKAVESAKVAAKEAYESRKRSIDAENKRRDNAQLYTEVVIADDIKFHKTNHNYERTATKPMRIVLHQGMKSERKYGDTGDCLKVFIGDEEVISFTLDFGAPEVLVPELYEVMFEDEGNDRETIRGYEVAKFKAAHKVLQQLKEALDEVSK